MMALVTPSTLPMRRYHSWRRSIREVTRNLGQMGQPAESFGKWMCSGRKLVVDLRPGLACLGRSDMEEWIRIGSIPLKYRVIVGSRGEGGGIRICCHGVD
jgi:hypothetical protein